MFDFFTNKPKWLSLNTHSPTHAFFSILLKVLLLLWSFFLSFCRITWIYFYFSSPFLNFSNMIIPPWITCFAGEKCAHKPHSIINFTQSDTKHLNWIKNGQMFCVCPDFLNLQISSMPFPALLYLHSNRPAVNSFHCVGCYSVYHRAVFGL